MLVILFLEEVMCVILAVLFLVLLQQHQSRTKMSYTKNIHKNICCPKSAEKYEWSAWDEKQYEYF